MTPTFREGDALLIVDVQHDFLPGGALAVPRGDEVVPVLEGWTARARAARVPVIASRDWHPPDHVSFAARGGPWPTHCVAGSPGAQIALALPEDAHIVNTATDRDREAYSAFDGTGLAEYLRQRGVRRLFVGGLALDYCVKASVLDARRLGFEVVLLLDATRAIDVTPGDGARALAEMEAAGVRIEGGSRRERASGEPRHEPSPHRPLRADDAPGVPPGGA